MVRRMTGALEDLEPRGAVADDPDVLGGNGGELAPERVEGVPVQAAGARLEACRIDDVGGADLGDVDEQPGMLAHERSRGTGVVEMDVREEEAAQVADLDVARRQRLVKRRKAARRAAVVEREPVLGLDEIGADPPWIPAVEEVERLVGHAGTLPGRRCRVTRTPGHCTEG